MAQYGRPDSDITTNGWGSTPLWQKLDETSPDDETTQISCVLDTSDHIFEVGLSGVTDPEDHTGHTVRVRIKAQSGTNPVNASAWLYEGATLRATLFTDDVIPDSYTTKTYTLTGVEAGNISDYTNLRVRVNMYEDGAIAEGLYGYCTWIEMEFPNAPVDKLRLVLGELVMASSPADWVQLTGGEIVKVASGDYLELTGGERVQN